MAGSKWRQRFRFIIRLLVIWAIEVIGLLLMVWLLPGVQVDSLLTAIVAIAAIGVINGLLWPLLSYIILPFAVLTLGLVSLAANALLIQLAALFVDGFVVATFWDALILSIGLTAINVIASKYLFLMRNLLV